MSINSREEANRYYNIINDLIDDYIDNNKIRPSNLKNYLKPGSKMFNKFLERNKLVDDANSQISKSDILKRVINDRNYIESDGLMGEYTDDENIVKFESFKYFESDEFKISSLKECLVKGIGKADKEMEKALSQYWDVSLSEISLIDTYRHEFLISDWKDEWRVIIYTDDEIDLIKFNIIDHLYDEIGEKEIEVINGISIKLKELIKDKSNVSDDDKISKFSKSFSEIMLEKLGDDMINSIISNCLGESWSFSGKIGKYSLWVY